MSSLQEAEFSFQYHIDLGNNKISPILITHLSDPYIEASKFCAREALPSILVTVLGDAMRDQMQHEKGLVEARRRKGSGNTEVRGGYHGGIKSELILSDTLHTQLKEEVGGSLSIWLHQDPSSTLTLPKRERPPSIERGNVFQSLYNNYREIEKKKQMSRKKSFEAIPFRPAINHLSEKIVLNKRRVEQEMNTLPPDAPSSHQKKKHPNVFASSSKSKLTYTVSAFHNNNDSRGSSRENLYERSSSYLKRSHEKRKRLRESIDRKLMEDCSFRPKINNRIR